MSDSVVIVVCDRCGSEVEGLETEVATAGFYRIAEDGPWSEFGHDGEVVCDECMLADARYKALYG